GDTHTRRDEPSPPEEGRDPIESEGDTTVWRSPVFQRLEEEAKAQLRLLLAEVEEREDPALDVRIVDSDAAAANLASIEHQVVGLRPCRAWVGVALSEVRVGRRGARALSSVAA